MRTCFAQASPKHLYLQALELTVIMTVTFFALLIMQYQSATQERENWAFQDLLLILLFLGLWTGPILLFTGRFPEFISAGRFGFTLKKPFALLFRTLTYFIVANGLTFLMLFVTLVIIAQFGNNEVPVHDTLEKLQNNPNGRQAILLAVSPILVVPLLEEILFRGLIQCLLIRSVSQLQNKLKQTVSPTISPSARWIGIVLAAIIFSTYHANWQHWPALFVLALCMGYSYEKQGNLLVPILMHSGFNLLPILLTLAEASALN